MKLARFLTLFIVFAFFLPACGLSSPTDVALDEAVPMEAALDDDGDDEEEQDCVEDEDGQMVCGLGGFLGSGS